MARDLADLYDKHHALELRLNTKCDQRLNASEALINSKITMLLWRGVYAVAGTFLAIGTLVISSHLILDKKIVSVAGEEKIELSHISKSVSKIAMIVSNLSLTVNYTNQSIDDLKKFNSSLTVMKERKE